MSFHVIVIHVPAAEQGEVQRVILEAPNAPDALGYAEELNRANCTEYGYSSEYYAIILDTATNGWAYNLTLDTAMPMFRAEELLPRFEAWREQAWELPGAQASAPFERELESKGESAEARAVVAAQRAEQA
jgi:hypothetical protein